MVAAIENVTYIGSLSLRSKSKRSAVTTSTMQHEASEVVFRESMGSSYTIGGLANESNFPYRAPTTPAMSRKKPPQLSRSATSSYELVPANDKKSLLKAMANPLRLCSTVVDMQSFF